MTNKQALREEFRNMQDHYSDPADRKRQEIYIAAEALLDELEAKDKLIAELEARAVTVAFKPLPLDELGSARDGKKYSPSFGAGYNCAVIHCDTELRQACANAGIRINGED